MMTLTATTFTTPHDTFPRFATLRALLILIFLLPSVAFAQVTVPTLEQFEQLQAKTDALEARVKALEDGEPTPDPDPIPDPDPTPDPDPQPDPIPDPTVDPNFCNRLVIETPHDRIPISGTGDGEQAFIVPAGETVEAAALDHRNIVVRGTLKLLDGFDVEVGTCTVLLGGAIVGGSRGNPISGTWTFRDEPLRFERDPEQWGTGLLVFGRLEIYGHQKVPFARLADDLHAGDTFLPIPPQSGWKSGDILGIPGTTQRRARKYMDELFEVTAEHVSLKNPATLELSQALQRDHLGYHDFGHEVLPHVANLSRSIVFRSANPEGTRGHIAFFHRASVIVHQAELRDLGRTTVEQLNRSVKLADGTWHIGTNQPAKYSIHAHRYLGPIGGVPSPNRITYVDHETGETIKAPPQFEWIGLAVNGAKKWGAVIHDSHFGLVRDLVGCNADGAVLVSEMPNDTGNVIEHCFGFGLHGGGSARNRHNNPQTGQLSLDFGGEGSAFWFRGSANHIRDCVAADCRKVGFRWDGYYRDAQTLTELPVPQYPGQDHWAEAPRRTAMPAYPATNCEAYSCDRGLWQTFSASAGTDENVPEQSLTNWTLWNNRVGIEIYHDAGKHMNRFSVLGDSQHIPRQSGHGSDRASWGMDLGRALDYEAFRFDILNLEIRGYQIGVRMATNDNDDTNPQGFSGDSWQLENQINLLVRNANGQKIRLTNIDLTLLDVPMNDQFAELHPWSDSPKNVVLWSQEYARLKTFAPFSAAINGERYYFFEQASGFVLPDVKGIPPALRGLTNQQVLDLGKSPIGGEIAPCEDRRDFVYGFVCEDQ